MTAYFTAERIFLFLDALFATISTITCVIYVIRFKHPIKWLFAFFTPFFGFVALGFWARALGIYDLEEIADFLRPPFGVIFLAPALFFFALKDWLK